MGRTEAAGIAIVGAWLGWTLFMWFAATRSFRTVNRVLGSSRPEFQQAVQPLGHDQARTMLRYLASEINGTFFRFYGWTQIGLGAGLVLLLWRQAPRDPAPPAMSRFWTLHRTFTGLDGVKLLAGLSMLVRWIVRA